MFAPKVAKAQTKVAESQPNKLAPQQSFLPARLFGGGAVEQALMPQRSIGNRATLGLIAQRATSLTENEPPNHNEQKGEPASPIAVRATPGVSWDLTKIPVYAPNGRQAGPPPTAHPSQSILQPKLAVGEINDPLEHEADRVADHVTGPSATAHAKPKTLGVVPAAVQTRAVADVSDERVGELGAGARLELSVRARMEPRFGHDFSGVRVHTGAMADRSARSFGALAYTLGRHVVFTDGRYAPHTSDGQRLLAHELAHVVQQHAPVPAPSPQLKAAATRFQDEPTAGCPL